MARKGKRYHKKGRNGMLIGYDSTPKREPKPKPSRPVKLRKATSFTRAMLEAGCTETGRPLNELQVAAGELVKKLEGDFRFPFLNERADKFALYINDKTGQLHLQFHAVGPVGGMIKLQYPLQTAQGRLMVVPHG